MIGKLGCNVDILACVLKDSSYKGDEWTYGRSQVKEAILSSHLGGM